MIQKQQKKYFGLWLLILLVLAPISVAMAIPALTAIKTKTLPSNVVRIQLQFTQAVKAPSHFLTADPATIVLDFKNVDLNLAKTQKAIPAGILTRYEAIQGPNKTRVVFFLKKTDRYSVRTSGKNVYVMLSGGIGSTYKSRHEVFAPTKKRRKVYLLGGHQIKGIDFNRSPTGSGQITVTLSDPNVNIDLEDKTGLITVNYSNTRVISRLQRTFDVTAFGTSVQTIQTANRGRNVIMLIRAKAPYQHMAYQVDNKFIIDVKAVEGIKQAGLVREPKKYAGKRLSLNFQTISVRAALQLLAQFAGINIVVSDTVTGDITLRLHNVPWDQALDIILQTRGLGERKIGDTLIIAPAAEIATREKQELQAQTQVQALEPLRSELIQINYGKAGEIASLLKGDGKSILSDRGSVSIDARTNTLWVQDIPQKLAEVRKLVRELDIPVKQVLIEARIVNIDNKAEKELGIRWGITRPHQLSGTLEGANDLANDIPPAEVPIADRLNVDLPAANVGTPDGPASIGLALAKLGSGYLLDLELSALQTENKAKIIASPRLITANQKEAIIESGEEIPYQEATSSGATSVSFKKAVLSLKVTPQITPDNRIILDLKVNQDKRGPEVLLGVPSIDTREIQTQVLVNNGQTVVLGGIFQDETKNIVNRIPFLSDIPLFGHLFRHTTTEDKQTELLIFVTPKIIKQSLYQQ